MHKIQLERDKATLENIAFEIASLIEEMNDAKQRFNVRERGYFTPDEEMHAKRMFFKYRNFRAAVMEIIYNWKDFDTFEDEDTSAKAFILAFASAIQLYHWSSLLVEAYKGNDAIVSKLNEVDINLGIEGNLFDQIYRNVTRVEIQEELYNAAIFYEEKREWIETHLDDSFKQLLHSVDRSYTSIKRGSVDRWVTRLNRDMDITGRRMAMPIKDLWFNMQKMAIDFVGSIWLDTIPKIPQDHIKSFQELMQPGDFFIVRPESKSSTVLIPGWWTHGSIYLGGFDALQGAGFDNLENVSKNKDKLINESGDIIEALSPGVVFSKMYYSMSVDHAVAIRPLLNESDRRNSINDALSHLGKPYDFDFDIGRSDRLVCTELLYKSFHKKGGIDFELKSRYGRPTINADDIIEKVLTESQNFQVIGLSLKDMTAGTSNFYTKDAPKVMKTLG
ncbi:MAG: hypothetical protein HRT89_22030 [Lentisphaeria bacterium]|nr:hypothetical protein [Lentisphaeria bacterium]NQZ70742.1 hypothetical protein [Lentisphaeria bacterium]